MTVDGPREPRSNKSKFKSLSRQISSMNNSPELPYALSEDGGDEDMQEQDCGNEITDDDYTPSVLPTSPIGRNSCTTNIVHRKERGWCL